MGRQTVLDIAPCSQGVRNRGVTYDVWKKQEDDSMDIESRSERREGQ